MKATIITIMIVVATAISAAAQCSDADRKALEAFDHAWGAATVSGDRAALMNIYADDFMGLPGMANKTTSIDNAVKAAEAAKKDPNPDKVTYDHYLITCTPNSALITHRNTIWTADGDGGKPGTFYTRSVHTLEKRGGKWVVVSNGGNGLDEHDTLWYLEQDWNDAALHKDKDWFEKNFASDYTSIGGDTGKLNNKAEDIAESVDPKLTMEAVDTTDMHIRIDGDRAIVTGVYHTKGTYDRKPFDRTVRYTDTWIRRDGRWVAWASQGTPMK